MSRSCHPERAQRAKDLLSLLSCLIAAFTARPANAQAPNLDWRTIRTKHFYVHFNPNTEPLARRIAANAERAYAQLSHEIHPPRGMIDLVLSDDVDFSNGFATTFPTNRIVVYANPPVSESALRFTNDWAQTVVTHELTHIFHLDRTRGIWSLGQHIFGRAAPLFPNSYSPSWLIEGLAVYEESKLTGAGRIYGSEHRMIARSTAVDHRFPPIGDLSLAQPEFPFGETAYGYGSLFVDYLAKSRGQQNVGRFVDKSAAYIIPYLINQPAKWSFGISFSRGWRLFADSVTHSVDAGPNPPFPGWRQLTNGGTYVFSPRWLSDSAIVYSGTAGKESFAAVAADLAGKRTTVGRRNSPSPNVPLADGSLLFSQIDYTNPYQQRTDLYVQRGGRQRQITFGRRLDNPDVRRDGQIVAVQITPGATHLVRVSPDGKTITPLTTGSLDEQWTEPRWSHSGTLIAASRWLRGNVSQIVVLDTVGRIKHLVSSGTSIEATPSWLPDDSGVMYSSDRTGSAEIYVERLADSTTYRLSSTPVGMFEPTSSPSGQRTATVLFRADGYHLGAGSCCQFDEEQRVADYRTTTGSAALAPVVTDTSHATKYSPWRTFYPRYWLPTIDQGIAGGYRFGFETSGYDVIGRHRISGQIEFPTNKTGVTGFGDYQYSGFGNPVIDLAVTQNWDLLGSVFERNAERQVLGNLYRRTRTVDLLATYLRPRYRTSMSLSVGTGLEQRTFTTTADVPLSSLDTTGAFTPPVFPNLVAAATFSNTQRPIFSISPEDGVRLAVTGRDRLKSGPAGNKGSSYSAIGTGSAYKSLNLPGFSHHVIALRGSVGWADERAAGYFGVGGVSGGTFQIIPGYTLGEGRLTFPVRGFEQSTLLGTRAFAGSVEYRAPLFIIGRAPGILPFFLDRSSLTLFSDYGTAWCPTVQVGREVCNTNSQFLTSRLAIASAGAELNLNLGVLSWDSPYQFRLGFVAPTYNRALFQQSAFQVYLVSGLSF
jgi:hypothetical protein